MAGRFGNWLFQYAAMRGVAAHHGFAAQELDMQSDMVKDLGRILDESIATPGVSFSQHCYPDPCQVSDEWLEVRGEK